MSTYVPSTEQLVVEVYARDLTQSIEFYRALGFEMLAIERDFVVLAWENHQFFLEARADLPAPIDHPPANARIMVPDVDRYWAIAQQLGAPRSSRSPIETTACAISRLSTLTGWAYALLHSSTFEGRSPRAIFRFPAAGQRQAPLRQPVQDHNQRSDEGR